MFTNWANVLGSKPKKKTNYKTPKGGVPKAVYDELSKSGQELIKKRVAKYRKSSKAQAEIRKANANLTKVVSNAVRKGMSKKTYKPKRKKRKTKRYW